MYMVFIDSQTFVYCDPPYRPLEGNSKAKVYGEMFDDTKQAELAGWAWEMRRKGARVVISNSDGISGELLIKNK